MKKWIFSTFSLLAALMITGCSGQAREESQVDQVKSEFEDKGTPEIANEGIINKSEQSMGQTEKIEAEQKALNDVVNARMVIYTANLSIEVTNFKKMLDYIQQELEKTGGYIVQSNSYSIGEKESIEGTITVRIPQGNFRAFLHSVESGSTKILDRSITGQDVTEEFVDLESRLKSKQVVEKRLLEFMEKAEKTEDLLNISSDLAAVQEEIEQIKGRMNYLDNQVSLATVTINVSENRVNVPGLDKEELNTWDKTKRQFMESVSFVLRALSTIIVFLLGNLPIFIILAGILITMLVIIKKKKA